MIEAVKVSLVSDKPFKDKLVELFVWFYAGFLTYSEFQYNVAKVCEGMGLEAAKQETINEITNATAKYKADVEDINSLSGTPNKKFIHDLDDLIEVSPTGTKYGIWMTPPGALLKDGEEAKTLTRDEQALENALGNAIRLQNSNEYLVDFVEEYGFVRINDWLISRTVGNIMVSDSEDRVTIIEDVVFAIPSMSEESLKHVRLHGSLDGGAKFGGVYELTEADDIFRQDYMCNAKAVFTFKSVFNQNKRPA